MAWSLARPRHDRERRVERGRPRRLRRGETTLPPRRDARAGGGGLRRAPRARGVPRVRARAATSTPAVCTATSRPTCPERSSTSPGPTTWPRGSRRPRTGSTSRAFSCPSAFLPLLAPGDPAARRPAPPQHGLLLAVRPGNPLSLRRADRPVRLPGPGARPRASRGGSASERRRSPPSPRACSRDSSSSPRRGSSPGRASAGGGGSRPTPRSGATSRPCWRGSPPGASVSAHYRFLPHLARRARLYMFPAPGRRRPRRGARRPRSRGGGRRGSGPRSPASARAAGRSRARRGGRCCCPARREDVQSITPARGKGSTSPAARR